MVFLDFIDKYPALQSDNALKLTAKTITIKISNIKNVEINKLQNDEYSAKLINTPFAQKVIRITGTIDQNLALTAQDLSIPYHAIMPVIKAYSHNIDFQRDIRTGDKLDVLLKQYYTEDGTFSHVGDITYAALNLRNKKVEIYQFIDANNKASYYDKNAFSVEKALLRTPVKTGQISSNFGMRKHPVLGYSRMHKGIDFAAPIGTPILAAGNGQIVAMGAKGGYGNHIEIKHNKNYNTLYAHLSKYAKKLKVGSKINQGQVIGYIGMTGITTGPHLHFEIIKNSIKINPANIKSIPQTKLSGNSLKKFNDIKRQTSLLINKIDYKNE
ncbi:glycyl-glycine endopeptidase ALE-1 precursor [Rickettsia endosymbiont of Cardiosporidium cionae]|nr:glycyl-glycine endopeptidase ALE-1 precursor [Rickettsia endosymbiont of Cardiosporidium cionae]